MGEKTRVGIVLYKNKNETCYSLEPVVILGNCYFSITRPCRLGP